MPLDPSLVPVSGIAGLGGGTPPGGDAVNLQTPDLATQRGFEAMMDGKGAAATGGAASGGPTALSPAFRAEIAHPAGALGDEVLGGLEKLGRDLGGFGKLKVEPPAVSVSTAGKTPASHVDLMRQMHDMFQSSMNDQARTYSEVFELELVVNSSEQSMKSLKSLLT